MSKVLYEIRDNIALLTLNNPPLNTWGFEQRIDFVKALEKALENNKVEALVITGSSYAFSGGADITEFGNLEKAMMPPNLNTIIDIIDESPKPIIAAISGMSMGGGTEISLGCHYRVATPEAKLALPEVKIGLLPGAGGTQRLPRLIGIEHATNFIISGEFVAAKNFEGTPLIDKIIKGDIVEEAIEYAKEVVSKKLPLKRARDVKIQDPNAEPFLQYAKNTIQAAMPGYPAPLKIIEALKAAVFKTFDEGKKLEGELFGELLLSPESKSLIHIFFSERAAAKISDVPEDTAIKDIKKIAVVGAGTMGAGITISFLNAGIPVTLLEISKEALDRGMQNITKIYEASVKKGKMSPEQVNKTMELLKTTLSFDDLAETDLVVEAVFEDMEVKGKVFKQLDEKLKKGAILASNTSTLDLNKLASYTKRPEDVIGMHFFSPANIMKLLEVVRGEKTSKENLATVMKVAKSIKKTPVVSGVCDGFIGNRMIAQYSLMAGYLIEHGAYPAQVDHALEKWGMAMGPFRMGDMAGNDIGWAIRKRHRAEGHETPFSEISDKICEMGRFGQKTGAGWYKYDQGPRKAIPDPEIDKLINEYRKEKGIKTRKISDEEIVQRCVLALINEGAKILDEKIADKASDIDVVYVFGYGFPPYRGGPMFYADTKGLFNIVRLMKSFAEESDFAADFWKPSKLLEKLASEGKRFNA